MNPSRTKIFLFAYFFPAWLSALLMWGDDRTSSNFEPSPPWFYYVKYIIQIGAILFLFFPFKPRSRPLLIGAFIASSMLITLRIVEPILEAEFILVSSSIQICIIAIFLCFSSPNSKIEDTDFQFLFFMFLIGFTIQVSLYIGFGRVPAHSITNVFIRFNGITNDSLAAGLILPALIPWAVKSKYSELKVLIIMVEALASGSLFAVVFIPLTIIGYLAYNRLYRFAAIIVVSIGVVGITFYDFFFSIVEIKFASILSHLRFFLNLSGAQYDQSAKSCAEEFCESFIESGMYLSPIYLVLFYALLLSFLFQFVWRNRPTASSSVVQDTLNVFGASLFVASLVHPVPLIPFAVPLFLIFASLYKNEAPVSRMFAVRPERV